ncbi:MAG: 2-phospho-L-lactate transferase [Candidatus Nanopelagicaceae bacterium]|nr:2-phospho-L-lactate transferase [Candidatus Nanopelagicaceae bacterium]
MSAPIKVVALAGGIGGARFLKGLRLIENLEISVVVNNGDDITMHGLRICPDLDSVIYNLAGESDLVRGWGRKDESWVVQEQLASYLGQAQWFNLGDKDYATHIWRTNLLTSGVALSEIVKMQCAKWGISMKIMPATNDYVETQVQLVDDEPIHFQEWWVKHRASLAATGFNLTGAESAKPAPEVLAAISEADLIILPPSNPIVSIGMILQIPGIREAISSAKAPVVGVSPIIGGNPVLGMADKCLTALGLETSATSVAAQYGDLLDAWLIADSDADQVTAITELGIKCESAPLLMVDDLAAKEIAARAIAMVR